MKPKKGISRPIPVMALPRDSHVALAGSNVIPARFTFLCALALFLVIPSCFTLRAAKAATQDSPVAAASVPIQVRQWFKPERGWLYVLDPVDPTSESPGHIWLLDPSTARVMGVINTGADPDFALSSDGARLYVAAKGKDRFSTVAIIDTIGGTILKTITVENRVVRTGLPTYSGLGVSADGLVLRILTSSYAGAKGNFVLETMDTATGDLWSQEIDLGDCGFGRFIDHPTEFRFDYMCRINNRIRRVQIDPATHQPDHNTIDLPWMRRLGIAQAFLTPDNENIAIIRGDGAAFLMNVATEEFSPTRMHASIQDAILPAQWPISTDDRIYLGENLFPNRQFYMNFDRSAVYQRTQPAYDFRVINIKTWRQIGKFKGKWAPYWTAALSPDGKLLYALSPQNSGLVIFDTDSLRMKSVISVGSTPSMALVAP
ncbi:MAG TPA: hypothetical protein VN727_06930 [Candidatus Binatia bacterium]|nr:hypothetical protein [Candidatus Binatia bacterium]